MTAKRIFHFAVILFFLLQGLLIGYLVGVKAVQQEAVERGYGEYRQNYFYWEPYSD